jgi:hypothetical protein
MKALGLDEASKRLPRAEAAERAAAAAGQPDLQPPLALAGGVTLQRRAPCERGASHAGLAGGCVRTPPGCSKPRMRSMHAFAPSGL